ncbi:hypothetical protein DK842_16135 [Chromobacterium phragmitis]|uniref:DUF5610 domain-containing protein n=1 Tax=Chromobacterium phragmitis TaxID=2202141 RepID=A0A344UN23_9NEIS|nr:DUF5610 domain-containing protein [Chromobacterium phragmitis]AXE31289.1 hypothetical protein DK842_16135 [Chromobacterium phragmitis]AXE36671.1 hypothetical protein DK843_21660 [Chromobacterium phragmitis]
MTVDDDLSVQPVRGVQPRPSGSHEPFAIVHRSGSHGKRSQDEDSADIGLSDGKQAAELLFSAAMDQIARLAVLDVDPAHLPEIALAGESHSQRLLLGMEALLERYRQRRPEQTETEARQAFAPLALTGLERGYLETCQVLLQLNVYSVTIAEQLQGLFLLSQQLFRERLQTS